MGRVQQGDLYEQAAESGLLEILEGVAVFRHRLGRLALFGCRCVVLIENGAILIRKPIDELALHQLEIGLAERADTLARIADNTPLRVAISCLWRSSCLR